MKLGADTLGPWEVFLISIVGSKFNGFGGDSQLSRMFKLRGDVFLL